VPPPRFSLFITCVCVYHSNIWRCLLLVDELTTFTVCCILYWLIVDKSPKWHWILLPPWSYCLEVKGNIITTVLHCQHATCSLGTVNRNSSHGPVWPCVCLLWFLGCMIYAHIFSYVLFYLGQSNNFPSCFGTGVTNLNDSPPLFWSSFPITTVSSWLHPLKGHCEQNAMRDKRVNYITGHPLFMNKTSRVLLNVIFLTISLISIF